MKFAAISVLVLGIIAFGPRAALASPAEIELHTKTGPSIRVPDFTNGRAPFFAEPGTSYYHLIDETKSDSFGYQLQVPVGRGSKITIGIFKRPFGKTRHAAEIALRHMLNVPQSTLCRLDIEVLIPGPVDQSLSGRNLGVGGCPGAVHLPGG